MPSNRHCLGSFIMFIIQASLTIMVIYDCYNFIAKVTGIQKSLQWKTLTAGIHPTEKKYYMELAKLLQPC